MKRMTKRILAAMALFGLCGLPAVLCIPCDGPERLSHDQKDDTFALQYCRRQPRLERASPAMARRDSPHLEVIARDSVHIDDRVANVLVDPRFGNENTRGLLAVADPGRDNSCLLLDRRTGMASAHIRLDPTALARALPPEDALLSQREARGARTIIVYNAFFVSDSAVQVFGALALRRQRQAGPTIIVEKCLKGFLATSDLASGATSHVSVSDILTSPWSGQGDMAGGAFVLPAIHVPPESPGRCDYDHLTAVKIIDPVGNSVRDVFPSDSVYRAADLGTTYFSASCAVVDGATFATQLLSDKIHNITAGTFAYLYGGGFAARANRFQPPPRSAGETDADRRSRIMRAVIGRENRFLFSPRPGVLGFVYRTRVPADPAITPTYHLRLYKAATLQTIDEAELRFVHGDDTVLAVLATAEHNLVRFVVKNSRGIRLMTVMLGY
jgi:hypothetical protein